MGKGRKKMQMDVLETLRRRDDSLFADNLFSELRASNLKIASPSTYRARAALTQYRRVSCLDSMSAFIASQRVRHQHVPILSIWDNCGSVKKRVAPDLRTELSSIAGKFGFHPSHHAAEIRRRFPSFGAGEVPA
ncbi:hypothetical protein [Pontibaca salina]|uniref:Uncharacterized protein n=1 Tax=Pontibaca salina TaxID=2795731 RepID=A0A934HU23_9RHOB|nr:hypothetical protein [Pontibaca salina]MBI6630831.1 hypothetical protein [Pontibaca salina]